MRNTNVSLLWLGAAMSCSLLAAGVLAGPRNANSPDDREPHFAWETSFGTCAWWLLPDGNVRGDGSKGIVDIPRAVRQSGGDDVESDYEFVLLPDIGLATDINNRRQVVGLDMLFQGGVLVDDGVVTPINFPEASFTQPTNINERGEIIGIYGLDDPSQHFPTLGFHRDSRGEFTTIEYPGAQSTFLWGWNEPGDIVGFFLPPDTLLQTPFILDRHGEFAILDVPGDGAAVALGINDQRTISGWFVDELGLSRGYLLEDDGTSVIEFPGALSSDVGRVNNQGEFNGIYFAPPMSIGSFLRTKQGELMKFSISGWEITLIRGINDRGDQCGAVGLDFFSPPQGFAALRNND